MCYSDGGGLTAKGRQRREAVRLEAAGLFAEGVRPLEVARRLRVSSKSAYQWYQAWTRGGAGRWPHGVRAGGAASCRAGAGRSWPITWSRGRPHTAGWRTRCGPVRG
ncbi:helix-turn-helix domain-containing protein [Streptomyces sp. NPDC057580]|uniref:helix-turn-helix domain-containing protein n=1 Tax=Streptomyces sp. NPDC057580 TaxID=3346173 RepID=UPI003686E9EE